MPQEFIQAPVGYLLVKVAARCNIDCSYCYWFRDKSVYAKPKLMSTAVRDQLLKRIEEQIVRHSLSEFSILLHGGEPMLWGIENFRHLAEECRSISGRTGGAFGLLLTTNGVLMDETWLDCFEQHGIRVSISIDGPAHIHDIHRRTFKGGPTHASVERAIRQLQTRRIPFGVLAVCNPAYHPREFVDFFTDIGINRFDIIFPDVTFEDDPPHIAQFYCDLFDIWLEANREERKLEIRSIESMLAGLLGGYSKTEAIGYGPQEVCTILSDGSMEPLDVLRIAGDGSTQTCFNIFDNTIEDIKDEPRWKAARHASFNLCDKCNKCQFFEACGGGYLPYRFSKQNGFDNPSAYCDDLYTIMSYMQSVLEKHVYLSKTSGNRVSIGEAVALARAPRLPRENLAAR